MVFASGVRVSKKFSSQLFSLTLLGNSPETARRLENYMRRHNKIQFQNKEISVRSAKIRTVYRKTGGFSRVLACAWTRIFMPIDSQSACIVKFDRHPHETIYEKHLTTALTAHPGGSVSTRWKGRDRRWKNFHKDARLVCSSHSRNHGPQSKRWSKW